MTDRVIEMQGRGARGESTADILRRLRLYGVTPYDDDATALDKMADYFTRDAQAIKNTLISEVSVIALAAELSASRAETAELILEVTTAGGWFPSETDPELLALPDGTGAFINTPAGDFYTVEMVAGAPVRRTTFLTRYTNRSAGLNLWEYAKGDGVTDDTAAVNLAITIAVGLGITRINCGGYDKTYLLGGPFITLGTFTTPSGGTVPFNRHKVRLYDDIHLIGDGAAFKLAGGSTYPGGIFGHPWWDGERLKNVKIIGITMDGNQDAQIVPPIPANGGGGGGSSVWQHGNMITGCFDGFEVADCVFRDARGHGINFNWASTSPDAWAAPQNLEIHHNEFVNLFTQACNAGFQNTSFHDNRIHGNGFWVAGFDIESGSADFAIRGVRAFNNTYDFRDGLSPPESMPQYASNSAEAAAGRRHTRQAISCYCPGSAYIGTTRDVIIRDELIYQGTLNLNRFSGVKVINPIIRNTQEDLPIGYTSASSNTISMLGFGWALSDCHIINPDIESPLQGHGIYASQIDRFRVNGGSLRGMRYAAMRADACSGSISDIEAIDFGIDDSGLASDQIGTQSSALVVYGGMDKPLKAENIRAIDTRSGTARRVRHAVYGNVASYPLFQAESCNLQNGIGATAVRDVNGTIDQNRNIVTGPGITPIAVSTMASEFKGDVKVTSGGLEVSSETGPAGISVSGGAGFGSNYVFRTAHGIEFIIGLTDSGQLNFSTYNNGTAVGNPLAVNNDGKLVLLGDWAHPIQIVGMGFLWMDSTQRLRTKGSAPTSDTDGTVVGTQT